MTELLLRPDVFAVEVGDDAVLLDNRTSRYLALNQTGAFLLTMLQQGTSEEELVLALRNEFQIDADTAQVDCAQFLATLHVHDLLV